MLQKISAYLIIRTNLPLFPEAWTSTTLTQAERPQLNQIYSQLTARKYTSLAQRPKFGGAAVMFRNPNPVLSHLKISGRFAFINTYLGTKVSGDFLNNRVQVPVVCC